MIPRTGMVILDVGMLSGLSLSPGAAVPTDPIRKVERLPDKVILYLDSVSVSTVCHGWVYSMHCRKTNISLNFSKMQLLEPPEQSAFTITPPTQGFT